MAEKDRVKPKEEGIPAIILVPVAGVLGLGAVLGIALAAGAAPQQPSPGKATLYGKVTDATSGQPMPDALVTLNSMQTSTDNGGNYTFADIDPGTYTFTVEKSGYDLVSQSLTLSEGLFEHNIGLVPVGVPVAQLTGKVTDAITNAPIEGVKVSVDSQAVYTTSAGQYEITNLTIGSHTVTFEKEDYDTATANVTLVEGTNILNIQMTPVAAPPEVGVEITNITISPTNLTSRQYEYETSLGIGYWGDPFTINITFSNPHEYDVWLAPDFALGKLTGEPLEYIKENRDWVLKGFEPKPLLYFRLLLSTEYAQGDYSYKGATWQKLWHVQNKGSNMTQYVYYPDGTPAVTGEWCWLKVPARSQATIIKNGHLGIKHADVLTLLPDVFDICVQTQKGGFYVVYDPEKSRYKKVNYGTIIGAVPGMVNIIPA